MGELVVRKALASDMERIVQIYWDAIDNMEKNGIHQWDKVVYPTRNDAESALKEGALFVCLSEGRVEGTFILNEEQARQYLPLPWKYNLGKALVLHTLAVHPLAGGRGMGNFIMKYIYAHAKENGYSAIRLDTFRDNKGAMALYGKAGYEYVGDIVFGHKRPGFQEGYVCFEIEVK